MFAARVSLCMCVYVMCVDSAFSHTQVNTAISVHPIEWLKHGVIRHFNVNVLLSTFVTIAIIQARLDIIIIILLRCIHLVHGLGKSP